MIRLQAPRIPVKLVIWDLDDTFWDGTLEEGGCRPIQRNLDIVRQLNRRGIINSICSKNIRDRVLQELERCGIADEFVFPRIAFEPKGAMVSSIVASAQLRPESTMFIDDNPINRNEVSHYNPGIQVAGPDFLPALLADCRFAGKNDAQLSRLQQYKILEAKETDRSQFVDDANTFLRQSEIRLSFHYDVLDEFERVHELVNRSNQLNFTKVRFPEELAEARRGFERDLAARDFHAGYVRVADRYGDYGICGFYATKPGNLVHFVFSCRVMNMGIEQFVYRRLGRLRVAITGEVASDLRSHPSVDWISVVPDAQDRAAALPKGGSQVCIRGACELDQATHYMRRLTFLKEFTFPYRGWGIALPLLQFEAVHESVKHHDISEVFDRLPGLHRRCLESPVFSGKADVFIFSFSLETAWGNYRYRKTGMIVPLRFQDGSAGLGADITTFTYQDLRAKTKVDMPECDWEWFLENFEYVGHFDRSRFTQNLATMLARLQDKLVIIVQLNTRFSKAKGKLKANLRINEAVREVTNKYAVRLVELDDLIENDAEALSAHHFVRPVYVRLARSIGAMIDDEAAHSSRPGLAPMAKDPVG